MDTIKSVSTVASAVILTSVAIMCVKEIAQTFVGKKSEDKD